MRSGEKKTGSGLLAIECGRKWESGSETSPAKDSDREQSEREREEREGEEKRKREREREKNRTKYVTLQQKNCIAVLMQRKG